MKIAIGIPFYNAHQTLPYTLASIYTQLFPLENLEVFIAIDGGDYGTIEEICNRFHEIKIYIIPSKENHGPGAARNLILRELYNNDNYNVDLVTFIDADDVFYSADTLLQIQDLYQQNNKPDLILTRFIQEKTNELVLMENNLNTWIHGRFFSYSFLKKYNFLFPNFYSNEDIAMCGITSYSATSIIKSEKISYVWKNTKNSITRTDRIYYRIKAAKNYVLGIDYALTILEKYFGEKGVNEYFFSQVANLYYLTWSMEFSGIPQKLYIDFASSLSFLLKKWDIKNKNVDKNRVLATNSFIYARFEAWTIEALPAKGFDEWIDYYTEEKWKKKILQ